MPNVLPIVLPMMLPVVLPVVLPSVAERFPVKDVAGVGQPNEVRRESVDEGAWNRTGGIHETWNFP